MSKKNSNLARQSQYQEKYPRKFPRCWFRYCKDPLEDIEGWAEMLNDTSGQRWHLHHRDEIQGDIVVSSDELKGRGEYLHLPANKLIFLTEFAHKSLHKPGEKTKKKLSDIHKGKYNPMYGHNKYGVTKEDLYELYVVQGLTQLEIGDKIGCHQTLISRYLKKFGIIKQDV